MIQGSAGWRGDLTFAHARWSAKISAARPTSLNDPGTAYLGRKAITLNGNPFLLEAVRREPPDLCQSASM